MMSSVEWDRGRQSVMNNCVSPIAGKPAAGTIRFPLQQILVEVPYYKVWISRGMRNKSNETSEWVIESIIIPTFDPIDAETLKIILQVYVGIGI